MGLDVAVVLLFFGLDVGVVLGALMWLSRRRAMDDITDLRFRRPGYTRPPRRWD